MASVALSNPADTVVVGEIILLWTIGIVFPSFHQDLEVPGCVLTVSFLIRVEVPIEYAP